MAKKEQGDREIAELLAELREQTESSAPSATEKASKKDKNMTDDDVKALLRRYYTDVDTLPQEKEPSFAFDTSDFVPDEPLDEEKPVEAHEEDAALTNEPVEEVFDEEETVLPDEPIVEEFVEPEVEETVVEPNDTEDTLDTAEDIAEEDNESTDAETESGAVIVDDAPNDDDDAADEILYDVTDLQDDNTEQYFTLGEDETSDEPVKFENTEETEKLDEDDAPIVTDEENDEDDYDGGDDDEEDELIDHPVLPDDEDSREWHPSNDVSGRSDDSELDFMVALGLGDKLVEKYGDERVRRAEEKLRLREEREQLEVNSHAYSGAELTPRSDIAKIKARYSFQQLQLVLKLVGSIALSLLLLFFENLRFFNVKFVGVFANNAFRTLIPMVILIGIAAFSYERLFEAVMFALGRRRRGNVILPIALIIMLGYDLLIILSFTQNAPLFNFPVALGFIFELFSELFDLVREKHAFSLLCDTDAGHLCGLTTLGNDERDRNSLSADAIPFVEGYFRRSSDNRRSYPLQLLLTVLPLAAGGALLTIASSVVGIEPVRAVSSFPAVFAFATPMATVFNRSWQMLRATIRMSEKKSAVLGGVATDEYLDARYVVFDDELAFPSEGIEIKNIKLYDNSDIYNTIYNVNALFQKAGGSLRGVMHYTAANLGQAKSAVMTAAGDHYVEALIDGENTVCAGSYAALTLRGIAIEKNPDDSRDAEDACVMYAAINGLACARFCVRYNVSSNFLNKAGLLADEGIGVRLRTLDPNLDRALLVSKLGDRIDAGVRREPSRPYPDEPSGASVVARGDDLALVEPLIIGRRLSRAERKLALTGVLQLMAGIVVATLVTFFDVPIYLFSSLAGIMQLLGVIPATIIYSLNVKLYKDKK